MKTLLIAGILSSCMPLQQTTETTEPEAICQQYRKLGCPEGSPTPSGATCETVLANMQTNTVGIPNRACVLSAVSCEQAYAWE